MPFLHALKKKADSIKKGLVLYCGDFNCVPNKHLDCSAPKRSTCSEIQPFLHISDLHDIWRCVNSGEKDFTYYSDPHKSYSRIDLFVSDLSLLKNVVSANIHPITWSDHAPISLSIREQNSAALIYQ